MSNDKTFLKNVVNLNSVIMDRISNEAALVLTAN